MEILNGYIKTHFLEEENFLKEHNYKYLTEHIQAHREFQNELKMTYMQYRKGNNKLERELFRILKDWFQNHILKFDKKYFKLKAKQ